VILRWVGAALVAAPLAIGAPGHAADATDEVSIEAGAAAYEAGDYQTAWFNFWTLAQRGNPLAQFNLSRLYEFGRGVEHDPVQARQWTEAAAQQGYPPAMFTLGQYSQLGIGGPANAEEARRWYARAAEAGYALAQFNLGLMYEIGYGGPRDLDAARLWYGRAADQKVDRARAALARLNGPNNAQTK